MKDLKKLMGKGEAAPDHSVEAKMKVLQELRDMMSQMMGDNMRNHHDELRKVAVMAKDKEGLQHGLEKAQELVSESPDGEESPEHEASESPEEEMGEHPEMSNEEIEREIERLQAMKK